MEHEMGAGIMYGLLGYSLGRRYPIHNQVVSLKPSCSCCDR